MTTKHRVLFTTLATFGGAKKGGGERYVSELARALRRRGWDVPVLAAPSIKTFAVSNAGEQPSAVGLGRARELLRSADLIHVHQLNSPGFDLAAVARAVRGTPLVLTDHGGGAKSPGRALGRLRLRMVDAAGFVSHWSAADVDPSGRVSCQDVIWGGGDHLPAAEPLPKPFDFGYVGRLLPHKGVHIAIEALPSDATLIVAGQARDRRYFAELEGRAAGKKVTFVVDADDPMIARVYSSIRYLLVPSVKAYGGTIYARPELLGLAALEALAAGVPVIGSDLGGLGELLRTSNQVCVAPGSTQSWGAALQEALHGEPIQVPRAKFTWDAVAQRCETLYAKAIPRRTAGR